MTPNQDRTCSRETSTTWTNAARPNLLHVTASLDGAMTQHPPDNRLTNAQRWRERLPSDCDLGIALGIDGSAAHRPSQQKRPGTTPSPISPKRLPMSKADVGMMFRAGRLNGHQSHQTSLACAHQHKRVSAADITSLIGLRPT